MVSDKRFQNPLNHKKLKYSLSSQKISAETNIAARSYDQKSCKHHINTKRSVRCYFSNTNVKSQCAHKEMGSRPSTFGALKRVKHLYIRCTKWGQALAHSVHIFFVPKARNLWDFFHTQNEKFNDFQTSQRLLLDLNK